MSTTERSAESMPTAAASSPHAAAPIALDRVQLSIDVDGIACLRLGRADEGTITLTIERIAELEAAFDRLLGHENLRAVIVTGPDPAAGTDPRQLGPAMFCAGADVNLIRDITDPTDGEAAAVRGRSVFQKLQQLRVPVIAAIEGPCLGGGLELALFCDVRIASDAPSTQIGLPEVKLGIVPGFGGTQNLTRLLGLPKALELILNGKLLRPKQALKTGVIDRLVPRSKLLTAARQEADRLVKSQRKAPVRPLRGMAFWLSRTPLRALAVRAANKLLQKGQARFYPAPAQALRCCVAAMTMAPEQGFAFEAKALGAMIVTDVSKALVHLFFLTERSKRLGKLEGASDVQRAFILGSGVMGAGIAGLMAEKGVTARLCDVALAPLARAKERLQSSLDKRTRRRHMERHEAQAVQDRLAVATDAGSLRDTDLWLEAVVEDLAVKQRVMADAVARGLPEHALLATNTSSLSVTAMAEHVPNPERVVGVHFFNPPEKMPLVEVIRGQHTSDAAVATACRLTVRLGKFPVVVKDSAGFLVNRCLAPYVNEAARLLLEGSSPESIDAAMLDFGMPMGPCRLLDEIGFDVATKVSQVMHHAFPERMQPCELFAAMVEAQALGQKSGGGLFGKSGRGDGPGRSVLAGLRRGRGTPPRQASRAELLQRLVYPLVDEAFRCLDEGLVEHEHDLDLGLVMGIGFPPFTGGITRFARREGLATIVSKLDELARGLDARFRPGDGLRRRAISN